MESQIEVREQTKSRWMRYRELMPGLAEAFDAMPEEAYKGGALDAKTKRLMALCAAVVQGCRGCMLAQTERALDLGASVDEILETCAVAISLGGTMGAAETTRVVQFLEEKGLI